jgi:glycosyltransferase involved in cell wall biosynthesis
MEKFISLVIPNYNNARAIGKCLKAVFASRYKNFEVIVIDDCSDDGSLAETKKFPCKIIALEKHAGAARARNNGALHCNGEILFFTDSDCLLKEDTLSIINSLYADKGPETILGGTYTKIPFDKDFFSTFQSLYIHYSETKNIENPDYIASHAMVIHTKTFRETNGFPEEFMPILEDVEFSHRLRRAGCRLLMVPDIQVRHIFGFTLSKSLKNAFRKTKYWIMYSLCNRDLSADSGTASLELKANGVSFILGICCIILWLFSLKIVFLYLILIIFLINGFISRKLLRLFYETRGFVFALCAFFYYTVLYPLPVITGSIAGLISILLKKGRLQ